MRCKILAFLAFSIFLSISASAIVINEFTTDPQTDWDGGGTITSSEEWIELYNPSNESINLTGWNITIDDSTTTNASTQKLTGAIASNNYKVIFKPTGGLNNDGQIFLVDNLGNLIDSVSYGKWDDGNETDNAQNGNANSESDECLARIPNAMDTNIDSTDFKKIKCTYGAENGMPLPNEQGLNATIKGIIKLEILPRWLEFSLLNQGSTNNPALNGPIIFNATGSTTDFNIEVTEVTGSPFDVGLKLDSEPATGKLWTILYSSPIQTTEPTLDVPEGTTVGQNTGTIVYTITGTT